MERTKYHGVYRLESGKYLVRWQHSDPKTGKPLDRRKRIRAKSAAEAAKTRLHLMEQETVEAVQRQTLRSFAISWLNGKMPELSPTTRATYAQQLEHITSWTFASGRVFGDYWLDAIEHADVIAYRDQSSAGLRPDTVNGRLRVLKTLLSDAVATQGLERNAAMRVAPLPKAPPRRERALTERALWSLLEWMREYEPAPQWYPLTLTLALTGMRWSEATGLMWSDVDYDRQVLVVRRRNLRGRIEDGTKAGRQILRTAPMLDELAAALRAHRMRVASSAKLAASGLVFPCSTGRPYPGGSSALVKPLRRAAEGTGLGRRVSAHDLRHTWNNILRRVAEREVTQSIVGHSTDEMTAHYSHVSDGERLAASLAGLRLLKG